MAQFVSVAIAIVILTIVRVMMEENVVRSDTENNDENFSFSHRRGRYRKEIGESEENTNT